MGFCDVTLSLIHAGENGLFDQVTFKLAQEVSGGAWNEAATEWYHQ